MALAYYAITKNRTTKKAPFALARFQDGIFERYSNGSWEYTTAYDGILGGNFIDFEEITEAEARETMKQFT
jgi:hypothetical protein